MKLLLKGAETAAYLWDELAAPADGASCPASIAVSAAPLPVGERPGRILRR